MEHNVVVRMAKVLYGMVLAVFVFNLLVLPLEQQVFRQDPDVRQPA